MLEVAVEGDEVGRPQLVQPFEDLVERPQLRVGARQDRRLEHPADDARDLQRPARPVGHRVDPRQHEAVEAVRQLEVADRLGVGRVDALCDAMKLISSSM